MDTHGDRGALDLTTVKNFTHQLLKVSPPCLSPVIAVRRLLSQEPEIMADACPRVLLSAMTTACCIAISNRRTC